MRILFIILLSNIAYGQEITSYNLDLGEQSKDDFVAVMDKQNDTIFSLSTRYCNEGGIYHVCSELISLDRNGNILNSRSLIQTQVNHRRKALDVSGDTIYIASAVSISNQNFIRVLLLNTTTFEVINEKNFSTGDNVNFYEVSSILSLDKEIAVSCWAQNSDNPNNFPDYCLILDKSTFSINQTLNYPYDKESCIYEYLFTPNGKDLVVYFSLLVRDPNISAKRGFIRYKENKEVDFHYLDSLNNETQHNYTHAALLLKNNNMVYKHKHDPTDLTVIPSDNEIVCIDTYGSILWKNNTLSISPFGEKHILSISEANNGDVICSGFVYWQFNYPGINLPNPDSIPPFPDTLELYVAPYILRLDGDNGEKIWEYSLIEFDQNERVSAESLSELFEISDNTLFGGGTYRSHITRDSFMWNSWFVHLPEDGCADSNYDCEFESFITGIDNLYQNSYEIFPFPNPFSQQFTISRGNISGNLKALLFDHSMSLVKILDFNKNDEKLIFNTENLPQGIYYLFLYNYQNQLKATSKLIKVY